MRLKPVLLAGPTASGKSALALEIARVTDGIIVNADALQVYDCWQVLSARPDPEECKIAPHLLYGHVSHEVTYSVGMWLRELSSQVLDRFKSRQLIIVGGTGLYFTSLTMGLADIPSTPMEIRKSGDKYRITQGVKFFLDALGKLDPDILEKIDINNPVRLQRAWEVAVSTGKPLSEWWQTPTEPLLPVQDAICILMETDTKKLRDRIDRRFDHMVENGALIECQKMLDTGWNPDLPSARALGASELIAFLTGEIPLDDAVSKAKTATHQYAKRQRSWFRNQMAHWHQVTAQTDADEILNLT